MRGPPNLSCPHGARHSRACQTLMARQRDALSELELDALSRIASYERDRKEEIVEELI